MSAWDTLMKDFHAEYLSSPKDFLRQPTISKTVHPNVQKLAGLYYQQMMESEFFRTTILPGMYDGVIGHPYQFDQLPRCSPLTVQHSYHLNLIKQELNVFIPTEEITHITEIGGGYGNLCRLIKNFGYKGKYSIIDFPQMLSVQREYLSKNSISNVEFSTLSPDGVIPSGCSILIATFSVNEMPMEDRQKLESSYQKYDYLFFAYNSAFDNINNVDYFMELRSKLDPFFETKCIKDPYKNSWFLICKKRISQ